MKSAPVLTFIASISVLGACASSAKNPMSASQTPNTIINGVISPITNYAIPSSQQVIKSMEKVANWQLPRLTKLDYLSYKRGESEVPTDWVQGTFFTGLTELAERSDNRIYEDFVYLRGITNDWQMGDRVKFGDDQLIAQSYIWYHLRNPTPIALEHVQTSFDSILRNPPDVELTFYDEQDENNMHSCQERWCWADALFMAPPVWFALSEVTNDPVYADYANQEFKATVDFLYDEDLHLMYRDSRFFDKKGEFGEPVFWARGSGWVFAGLVRTMEYIEQDHPDRQFYETLYLEMAEKLQSLQRQDGAWSMSLLAKEKIKEPEMSGTGFFVYGLAWGINQGLLSKEDYWPTVAKGWHALNTSVHGNGKLGWVQGIGAAPGEVSYDDSQIYGVGAYLLAGSMIYDMAKLKQ